MPWSSIARAWSVTRWRSVSSSSPISLRASCGTWTSDRRAGVFPQLLVCDLVRRARREGGARRAGRRRALRRLSAPPSTALEVPRERRRSRRPCSSRARTRGPCARRVASSAPYCHPRSRRPARTGVPLARRPVPARARCVAGRSSNRRCESSCGTTCVPTSLDCSTSRTARAWRPRSESHAVPRLQAREASLRIPAELLFEPVALNRSCTGRCRPGCPSR